MKIFKYVVLSIGNDYRIETYARNLKQAKEIRDKEKSKGRIATIIKY